MNMKLNILCTSLAAVLMLAACSGGSGSSDKKADTSAGGMTSNQAMDSLTQQSQQEVLGGGQQKQNAPTPKQRDLPQPSPNTPDSDYVKLTHGNQLMFLYWANTSLPLDYDSIAGDLSQSYRSTSDQFRKHDLMKALKPNIAAKIAEAKNHPYVTWTASSPRLSHFDFDRSGFRVGTSLLDDGGSGYMYDNSDYNIHFTNGSDFQFLPVKDQDLARKIENMVANDSTLHLKIFGFAQSSSDSREPTVNAKIVKAQLLDQQGHVLLTKTAK